MNVNSDQIVLLMMVDSIQKKLEEQKKITAKHAAVSLKLSTDLMLANKKLDTSNEIIDIQKRLIDSLKEQIKNSNL